MGGAAASGFFLQIDSSTLWSDLETSMCTVAKPCVQIQALIVPFCLHVTFLRWCEQL